MTFPTIITAHAGCEGTVPNSLDNVRTALSTGAEMIELDIRHGEGVGLYLSHDRTDPRACVPFGEALDLLKETPRVRLNCDVKTEGLAREVMEEAARRDMLRQIVFTGSCMGEQALIRETGAEFWHSIWKKEEFEDALASCRRTGTRVINLPHGFVNPANRALLDIFGIGFSAWTADTEDEIRRLLGLRIYNITTRRPVLALALRKEIQGG